MEHAARLIVTDCMRKWQYIPASAACCGMPWHPIAETVDEVDNSVANVSQPVISLAHRWFVWYYESIGGFHQMLRG